MPPARAGSTKSHGAGRVLRREFGGPTGVLSAVPALFALHTKVARCGRRPPTNSNTGRPSSSAEPADPARTSSLGVIVLCMCLCHRARDRGAILHRRVQEVYVFALRIAARPSSPPSALGCRLEGGA